ncbi:hypothetical protein HYX19_00410 [Candidatus Woesearchaeota archaeon]|nr:hypothetical protein [Candidatus Woesearchaeota archaeon]
MKKYTYFLYLLPLVIILIFLMPYILPAEKLSDVSTTGGFILKDQIWEGEIYIKKNLNTPFSAVVRIMPGTKINVAKSVKLTFNGKLIATGAVDNPIRFTSIESKPNPGDWEGIYVNGADSILDNVQIGYAENDVVINAKKAAVKNGFFHSAETCLTYNTNTVLENNRFKDCETNEKNINN